MMKETKITNSMLLVGYSVQVGTFVGPWVLGIAGDFFVFPIVAYYLYLTFLHLYVLLLFLLVFLEIIKCTLVQGGAF